MAIVKQTLHPEGDTGTDIYPKTSVDQIVDLPVSAQGQLYAHYGVVTVYNKLGGTGIGNFSYNFINSKNTASNNGNVSPAVFQANLLQHVSSRINCNGLLEFFTDNIPAGATANLISALNVSADNLNTNGVQLINNGAIVTPTIINIDLANLTFEGAENVIFAVTETVAEVGSNAG